MSSIQIPEPSWLIREAEANELNFIYSTWLNSYRYDSSVGKSCRNTIFFSEYPHILDAILERSKVLVAYFAETPTVILAYLVYEPGIVHYSFTKEVYRKNGIAMSLFLTAFEPQIRGSRVVHYSHRTATSEPILQKYEAKLNFNPFKLYNRLQPEGEKNG